MRGGNHRAKGRTDVSRFEDYDCDSNLPAALWEANVRRSLKGRRGRRALAELREALMALPEHRLIEGALCTVGATQRIPEMPDSPWGTNWARVELAYHVSRQGEGVCANGAYAWYQKVKAGMDPAEAFASLPVLLESDSDPVDTALLGKRAGLTFTFAWELAIRNDETFEDMTPEERHAAFIAWIDRELAETAGAAS